MKTKDIKFEVKLLVTYNGRLPKEAHEVCDIQVNSNAAVIGSLVVQDMCRALGKRAIIDNYTKEIFQAYKEAAAQEHGKDTDDIPAYVYDEMRGDVIRFVSVLSRELDEADKFITPDEIGYRFWHSRNRAGVGFWDCDDLPENKREWLQSKVEEYFAPYDIFEFMEEEEDADETSE